MRRRIHYNNKKPKEEQIIINIGGNKHYVPVYGRPLHKKIKMKGWKT